MVIGHTLYNPKSSTMVSLDIRRSFMKWFKKNSIKFNIKPIFIKLYKNQVEFQFHNVPTNVLCNITRTGATIWVNYNKEIWDSLADFPIFIKRTSWGQYYCEGCLPERREFFLSKQALWENHCFQPLLRWINDNLNRTNWLVLFQHEGSTWVGIKKKEEVKNLRVEENFIQAMPLIVTQNIEPTK
jgi:hypothetical protein